MKRAWAVLWGVLVLTTVAPAEELEYSSPLYERRQLLEAALEFLGVPYRSGGSDAGGMDCSGLVYRVLDDRLPGPAGRTVVQLYQQGDAVSDQLLPGDLVFFDTTGGPSHVGLYLGNDEFIHAASEGPETGVIVSSLREPYYLRRYLGARRLVGWEQQQIHVTLSESSGSARVPVVFYDVLPLRVSVEWQEEERTPVMIRAYRGGVEYLAQRMVLSAGRSNARISFFPEPGEWYVQLSAAREAWQYEIRFTVQGGIQ